MKAHKNKQKWGLLQNGKGLKERGQRLTLLKGPKDINWVFQKL